MQRPLHSLMRALGFVSAYAAAAVAAETGPGACRADLSEGVLTLANARIERRFAWNGGDLQALSAGDVARGRNLDLRSGRADLRVGRDHGRPRAAEWSQRRVAAGPVTVAHREVTVTTTYAALDLRRVFRIYPDCPVIGCDLYVRVHAGAAPAFRPEDTTLSDLRPAGVHWRYRAVEFIDRTDGNNTLVRETETPAYLSGASVRGNLLWARSPLKDTAFFLVKEAPCSFVQLQYPGHDFVVSTGQVRAVGMGVSPADLVPDQWVRVYGLALGVCGAEEIDFLRALRSYQKCLRRFLPERDDMIMMNTWGDRNRDASIGEAFVRREVDACVRLGVTCLQIDDGWQQGLSTNSAVQGGGKHWDLWDEASWQPHAERFPRGLGPVVQYARQRGVSLGLWFHPSNAEDYAYWERDARTVVNLQRRYGIRCIKIDGIKLPTKRAELNLRRFFDRVQRDSEGQIVINLDATADKRTGYHWFTEYGNIFLENRYTDWGRYYPHWTLRNLWMLARYVPPEKLQIEFLNVWRNADKYGADDPLAPARVPFVYAFAVTMMGQPLAWFEGSHLPEAAFAAAPAIQAYRAHQARIHAGTILPIGREPDGTTWTGFQSLTGPGEGYLLILREYTTRDRAALRLYDLAGSRIRAEQVCGQGRDFTARVGPEGRLTFTLPGPHTFALYRYRVAD